MFQSIIVSIKKVLTLTIIIVMLPIAGCSSLSLFHHKADQTDQAITLNPNQHIVIVSSMGDANFLSYTKANCWIKFTCDGDKHFDYDHELTNFNLNTIAADQTKKYLNQQGFQHVDIVYLNIKDYYKMRRSYGYNTYNYAAKQTADSLKKQLKGKSYDYVIFISRINRGLSSTRGALPSGAYGLWQLRVKKIFNTLLYWDYTITLYNQQMQIISKQSQTNRISLPIDHWIAKYSELTPQYQIMMKNGLMQIANKQFMQSLSAVIPITTDSAAARQHNK